VIGNVPDLTRLPRFQRAPDPHVTLARVNAYNEGIALEASDVSASVVDLFAQPVREEFIFDVDGFHPNDAGHREISRLFLQVILPKLGVK
jgi:lysophospholipase L1-like esterase